MRIDELGYLFEIRDADEDQEGCFKEWMRQVGILGEPTDNPFQYPEHVYMSYRRDPAAGNGAGGYVFQISFKRMTDAVLFKLRFGGEA